ncbi:MAG TPA: glyoxalase superfamily protein [Mucilaginibacter sp.]|nr:glyoxalase superfamily protein [Mucilaginibacter sp.]
MKFESLVPILYSYDVQRSITYYTEVLGFENQWKWDDPVTFGCVESECVRLFFCKGDQGHPGTWICINLENVDEYYAFIKERGAVILSPPADKEWLMREMLVQDPDGHIIRFGHGIGDD